MRKTEGSLRSTSCCGDARAGAMIAVAKWRGCAETVARSGASNAALAGVALGLYNTVTPDRVRGLVGSRA